MPLIKSNRHEQKTFIACFTSLIRDESGERVWEMEVSDKYKTQTQTQHKYKYNTNTNTTQTQTQIQHKYNYKHKQVNRKHEFYFSNLRWVWRVCPDQKWRFQTSNPTTPWLTTTSIILL